MGFALPVNVDFKTEVSYVYTLTSKPWRPHAVNAAVLLLFFVKEVLLQQNVYTHTHFTGGLIETYTNKLSRICLQLVVGSHKAQGFSEVPEYIAVALLNASGCFFSPDVHLATQ